jgi:hypothetical protein
MCAVLCHAVLCCDRLCFAGPLQAILPRIMLCCAVLQASLHAMNMISTCTCHAHDQHSTAGAHQEAAHCYKTPLRRIHCPWYLEHCMLGRMMVRESLWGHCLGCYLRLLTVVFTPLFNHPSSPCFSSHSPSHNTQPTAQGQHK